jgi:hypothetical protein
METFVSHLTSFWDGVVPYGLDLGVVYKKKALAFKCFY